MADLTHDSADEAFHEIQLSGKQLVFLFMATTVVSVVIFLCGVLVGRGVRAEEIGMDPSALAAASEPPAATSTPAEPVATEPPTPPADAQPQLSYHQRLESEKATAEELKPRSDPPKRETETPKPAAAPTDTVPTSKTAGPGARPGTWAVQVVSLRDRGAASQVVQRLRNKNYPAFVLAPTGGAPTQLYKVQVGRYGDRTEAEQIASRLKKEEQFQPIIVR